MAMYSELPLENYWLAFNGVLLPLFVEPPLADPDATSAPDPPPTDEGASGQSSTAAWC